jgi:HEAT repeat protein
MEIALRRGLAAVAALLLLVGCGDPVDRWTRRMEDQDPEVRRAAVGSVWHLGARSMEAAPYLLRAAGDPDGEVRSRALHAVPYVGLEQRVILPVLFEGLQDPDAGVRQAAAYSLGEHYPRAPGVVSRLLPLLDDPDTTTRFHAIVALGKIGPPAAEGVPRLLREMGGKQGSDAIWALGRIGAEAAAARPGLENALETGNPDRRLRAAGALWKIGEERQELLDVLAAAFPEGVRAHQSVPSEELEEIGAPAVPHLVALLGHEDRRVRSRAARTLGRIGPDAREAVPALARALKDEEVVVINAVNALMAMGPAAREALPALERARFRLHPDISFMAASAVARIDPARSTSALFPVFLFLGGVVLVFLLAEGAVAFLFLRDCLRRTDLTDRARSRRCAELLLVPVLAYPVYLAGRLGRSRAAGVASGDGAVSGPRSSPGTGRLRTVCLAVVSVAGLAGLVVFVGLMGMPDPILEQLTGLPFPFLYLKAGLLLVLVLLQMAVVVLALRPLVNREDCSAAARAGWLVAIARVPFVAGIVYTVVGARKGAAAPVEGN